MLRCVLLDVRRGPKDTKQDIKGQGLNSYHWLRGKARDGCPGNASHAIDSYYRGAYIVTPLPDKLTSTQTSLRKDRVMSVSISTMYFPGQKLKSHKSFSFPTSILSFACSQSANNSLLLESHYLRLISRQKLQAPIPNFLFTRRALSLRCIPSSYSHLLHLLLQYHTPMLTTSVNHVLVNGTFKVSRLFSYLLVSHRPQPPRRPSITPIWPSH